MRKLVFSVSAAFTLLAGNLPASENPLIGVVNFSTCITESKMGQKEQENMESMRQQMIALMEGNDKKMKEIALKFEDPEYLDSLSPKAEEELKMEFQTLQEEQGRYQNQFYQVLNQANHQMIQKMNHTISEASERIAAEKGLDYVMNKEACFFIRSDLDVTDSVISEMDRVFEKETLAPSLTESNEAQKDGAQQDMTTDQAG